MFDFGIGGPELLIIAVIAIIVVGPKDLPKLLRTVGKYVSKIRSVAREFQGHLEDAARDTGLDEVKGEVDKMTNFTVTDLDKDLGDFTKEAEDVESEFKSATADVAKPAPRKPTKKAAKKPAAKKPVKKPAVKKSAKKPAKVAAK